MFDFSAMSIAEATLLQEALEQHALLARLDGRVHAMRRDGDVWTVWELAEGAERFTVRGDSCSCQQPGCRHVRGVRFGSDEYKKPWKYTSLRKKRKRHVRED